MTLAYDFSFTFNIGSVSLGFRDIGVKYSMCLSPIIWLPMQYVFGLSVRLCVRACVRECLARAFSTDLPSMSGSGVTSHRQARQCRGAQGPKTVKGARSAPELGLRSETVIRLCTGILQNHHPCLLILHFRTGRYLLFQRWTRARGERLPGAQKL